MREFKFNRYEINLQILAPQQSGHSLPLQKPAQILEIGNYFVALNFTQNGCTY